MNRDRSPSDPVKGCGGSTLVREAKGKGVADHSDELQPMIHHGGRSSLDLEPRRDEKEKGPAKGKGPADHSEELPPMTHHGGRSSLDLGLRRDEKGKRVADRVGVVTAGEVLRRQVS